MQRHLVAAAAFGLADTVRSHEAADGAGPAKPEKRQVLRVQLTAQRPRLRVVVEQFRARQRQRLVLQRQRQRTSCGDMLLRSISAIGHTFPAPAMRCCCVSMKASSCSGVQPLERVALLVVRLEQAQVLHGLVNRRPLSANLTFAVRPK